ncbi:hypothetical protein EG327_010122 [Venturia inaequalis]|uniref:F-box domain-containing protein n=1 Tax=Venturia inaequalis TaxID=5025 RepID=A0A8H3YRK5_VENIN|nr:hypothetical protein EG327_010122 [Venturia inaequalis]
MEEPQSSLLDPSEELLDHVPSDHDVCPQLQSKLLSLPTELRLHILGYLLPDRDSAPIRPSRSRSHPFIMTRNRATDRDRESFKALQRERATGTQDPNFGCYVGTRMNLEPSYPEVMRVNRQIYQESIHLIWGSSEKQVEVELEKDGLYIFSRLYKASMEDQNLPHLGFDLRNVKSILLVIRDQDYKNWPSRVLLNVLGLALLGNKSLVKLSIVFWFLIRQQHDGFEGRRDAQCREQLQKILQMFHDRTPKRRRDPSIKASRKLLNGFLHYMDDFPRLFPAARWSPHSDDAEVRATLLQRAFEAYYAGSVSVFKKVLDDTETQYLEEQAHGLASLDKMRRALGDKAAKDGVAKDGVAKDGVAKDGVAKDGVAKDGVAKDGVAKDGAAKDGAAKDGAAKDGAAEDGAVKDGAAKDGAAKDGAAQ